MNESENDKRLFTRIQFDTPVAIEQGDFKCLSEITDISLKGVLLKDLHDQIDHEKSVHLNIMLASDVHIQMQARWSHSRNGYSGFHWEKVDIESMMHLRRLLELNHGDTDLLERELLQLSDH